jgi:hypothetical protein
MSVYVRLKCTRHHLICETTFPCDPAAPVTLYVLLWRQHSQIAAEG